MSTISYDSFMAFCEGLEGKTLSTIGVRSSFKLSSVRSDCLEFVVSTKKTRRSHRPYIEDVLNTYALTQSLHPVDYTSINSSYILALIGLFVQISQRKLET